MKRFESLLLAPTLTAKQFFRTSAAARLAAALCLGLVLLIPLGVAGYYYLSSLEDEAKARVASANAQKSKLDERAKPVAATRAKLADIRRWEPALRARLPVGGVMSALEKVIGPEHLVTAFRLVAREVTRPHEFRVAGSYALTIEGVQAKGDATDLAKLANGILEKLPSGSKLASLDLRPSEDGSPGRYTLNFIVAAAGDWSRLGLNRVPIIVTR